MELKNEVKENILQKNEENDKLLNNKVVKVKKKRGRKPKKKPDVPVVKEKKKRGRKPKKKPDVPVIKEKKKRGRKPTGRIIDCSKNTLSNVREHDNCIIAHIPIPLKDLNKIINDKTETTDNSSEINESNEISSNEHKLSEESNISNKINIISVDKCKINNELQSSLFDNKKKKDYKSYSKKLETKILQMKKIIDRLNNNLEETISNKNSVFKMNFDFIDIEGEKYIFKDKTKISCWWCCHKFDTKPFGIPIKYYNNKYHVFGCFCSISCAYSYNIEMNDYKLWDRLSLLKQMSSKIYGKEFILKSAPPRQSLKKFGGSLEIEQFRLKSMDNEKTYRCIMPPMIPIVPMIEESNKNHCNYNKVKRHVPLNIDRVTKANKNLKLKRTKPLPNSRNSLEKTMKLKKSNII
jgi:hypothetical protein